MYRIIMKGEQQTLSEFNDRLEMTDKLSGKRKNIGNQWDDANKKIAFAKRQKKTRIHHQ